MDQPVRVRQRTSRIRNKIIIPYLILALLITVVGATVAFFIIAGSLQERLVQRLRQSALRTTSGLVDFEDSQLGKLRPITLNGPNEQDNLLSTAAAYSTRNQEQLTTILRNGVAYYRLDRLVAFDPSGAILAEADGSSAPLTAAAAIDQTAGVQYILTKQRDILDGKEADKYSAIVELPTANGPQVVLYTVVPVRQRDVDGNEVLVGGLLATEPLTNVLQEIQQRSDAFYTAAYSSDGRLIASTAARDAAALTLPSTALGTLQQPGEPQLTQPLSINRRPFLFVFSPLRIREHIDGFFAVGLEQGPIFSSWPTARLIVLLLTLSMLAAVVVVGNTVAQRITRPLQELAATATDIGRGRLERRVHVRTRDEVGTLGHVLNDMTERLLDLYRTSRELGTTLELPAVLQATSAAVQRLVPEAQVATVLPDQEGWAIWLPAASTSEQISEIDREELDRLSTFCDASSIPHITRQESLQALEPRWALPLRNQQQAIGLLIIGSVPAEVETDTVRDGLQAIASMATSAFQNALLYGTAEQEAARNRAILQSIADGVIVCDPAGRVMLANQTALTMLEQTPEELYTTAFSALPLEPLDSSPELFAEHQRKTPLYKLSNHTISLSIAPVVGSEEQLLGAVAILHDVTAQHEIDQAKTNFIATISHELRTPLTPVRGYLDMLLRPSIAGDLNETQEMFINTILQHINSMNNFLNSIILLASIEAGTMVPNPAPVALAEVVDEIIDPMRDQLKERNLKVTTTIPAELPLLYVDREHLKIGLSKIVDNAYRYTNEGSITITGWYDDGDIQIDVTDTGQGMTVEEQQKLFTRFNRGGEQRGMVSQERGAGLGLAITRQLIEEQDGTIWVTSEVGCGTTISVRVPSVSDARIPEPEEASSTVTPG